MCSVSHFRLPAWLMLPAYSLPLLAACDETPTGRKQLAVQGGLAIVDLFSDDPSEWKYQVLRKALGLGAQVGILLPFSRTHEKETDTVGLDLVAKAGFDPRASLELWENMAAASQGQPIEFLSTHPSHETRSEELEENMAPALTAYQAAQSRGLHPDCK